MITKTLRISVDDDTFIDISHELAPESDGGYVISIHSLERENLMADIKIPADAAKRLRIFLAQEES